MVAWIFLGVASASLISALPRDVSMKVIQRWKPGSWVNSAPRVEDAAYVRSVVTMHRRGRNGLVFEHEGRINVVVVHQSDEGCHYAESFLWSDDMPREDQVRALAHFYREYCLQRSASLLPRLAPADTQIWYDAMQSMLDH